MGKTSAMVCVNNGLRLAVFGFGAEEEETGGLNRTVRHLRGARCSKRGRGVVFDQGSERHYYIL